MQSGARLPERVWGAARPGMQIAGTLLAAAALASCGDLTRQGTASSFLMISELTAASGAEPQQFGSVLYSDVETLVDGRATIFSDIGRVRFSLGLKDPGSPASPAAPSANNAITVNRYRVRFIRADGRNTPGVDVPFGFDGAFTVTVRDDMTAAFELVRLVAKSEAPLAALKRRAPVISTIAEITFYGHDQTGREVSVMGRITVDFGDFSDPS